MEGGADPDFFNSNGIWRGYKRDVYEGGIRVPMIISWPGHVQPSTETDFMCSFWDLMPTFREVLNPKRIPGIWMVSVYFLCYKTVKDRKNMNIFISNFLR